MSRAQYSQVELNDIPSDQVSINKHIGKGCSKLALEGKFNKTSCVILQSLSQKSCEDEGAKIHKLLSDYNRPFITKFYGMAETKCNNGNMIRSMIVEHAPGTLAMALGDLARCQKHRVVWINTLLDAVRFLHEKLEISHTDIKCANILLSAKNQLKLTDFGEVRMKYGAVYPQTPFNKYLRVDVEGTIGVILSIYKADGKEEFLTTAYYRIQLDEVERKALIRECTIQNGLLSADEYVDYLHVVSEKRDDCMSDGSSPKPGLDELRASMGSIFAAERAVVERGVNKAPAQAGGSAAP